MLFQPTSAFGQYYYLFEALADHLRLIRVVNRVKVAHRDWRANRHQDIGVIDRSFLVVTCFECYEGVSQAKFKLSVKSTPKTFPFTESKVRTNAPNSPRPCSSHVVTAHNRPLCEYDRWLRRRCPPSTCRMARVRSAWTTRTSRALSTTTTQCCKKIKLA